jgi:hypothetical protein
MKRTVLFLLLAFLLSVTSSFAQITMEEFYDDPGELLVHTKVYEFDSLPREEISKRLKNWAGANFVNSREVIVSETEDQMVLVYSMNKFFVKVLGMRSYLPWYIRLVVQIKDDKMRCLFYDDGNVFRPGSYNNGYTIPSTPARRNRFKDYMRNGVSPKNQTDAYVEVREYIILTGESISESVKKDSGIGEDKSPGNDW